jgi:signal peptidase I
LSWDTVVIRRLLLGAVVSVVLFTVGIAGLGWKPYVVTSESMAPAMNAGDVILVDPQATSLAVYEIVTYTDPRGLVTHRVIAQAEDGTFPVFRISSTRRLSASSMASRIRE